MRTRLVLTIGAVLAFAPAQGAEDKRQCFGSYGDGDCTNKQPGECVKLAGGYVLEICPEPGPYRIFPRARPCPPTSTPQEGERPLCSEWSYILTAERGTPSRSSQLSLSLPASVRVLESGDGTLHPSRTGDPGQPGPFDPAAQVLELPGRSGVFRFVTQTAHYESRPAVIKVEGSRDVLATAIRGPSARPVDPFTETVHGWTDRAGNVIIERSTVQGDEFTIEVTTFDGKPRPVRTVPLSQARFCKLARNAPGPESGRTKETRSRAPQELQNPITDFDCAAFRYMTPGSWIETIGKDPCKVMPWGELRCY